MPPTRIDLSPSSRPGMTCVVQMAVACRWAGTDAFCACNLNCSCNASHGTGWFHNNQQSCILPTDRRRAPVCVDMHTYTARCPAVHSATGMHTNTHAHLAAPHTHVNGCSPVQAGVKDAAVGGHGHNMGHDLQPGQHTGTNCQS